MSCYRKITAFVMSLAVCAAASAPVFVSRADEETYIYEEDIEKETESTTEKRSVRLLLKTFAPSSGSLIHTTATKICSRVLQRSFLTGTRDSKTKTPQLVTTGCGQFQKKRRSSEMKKRRRNRNGVSFRHLSGSRTAWT